MISIYLFLFLLLIYDHDIFDQKILVKMDILIIFRVQYKKRIDITDRLRILTIIGGQMANICILAKLLYLLLPKWDGSFTDDFGTPVLFSNAYSPVRSFSIFPYVPFYLLFHLSFNK